MVDFTGGTWRSLIDGEEVGAIPDSVVDNFNDDDAEPAGLYNGNSLSDFYEGAQNGIPSGVSRDTSRVFEGSHSLEVDAGAADGVISRPTDGLNRYWSPEDDGKLVFNAYVPSDGASSPTVNYGVISGEFSGYQLRLGHSGYSTNVVMRKIVDGDDGGNFGDTGGISLFDEWLKVEYDWDGENHTHEIFDSDGNLLFSGDGSDTDYDGEGIAITQSYQESGAGWIDNIRIE